MDNKKILTEIIQVRDGQKKWKTDVVIREISLTISINMKKLVTISCLDDKIDNLALGFIFSEGLIQSTDQILAFEYFPENNWFDFTLDIEQKVIDSFLNTGEKTSGCGSVLSNNSNLKENEWNKIEIDSTKISQISRQFQKDSKLFLETGGVHAAALIRSNKILFFAEDLGRHNAVDKIIGEALLEEIDLSKTILFTSGRISSEITRKIIRAKIPMIVSHSAPTSETIRLGWKYHIFIIGFTRGNRFNLYTGFNDIIIK